MRANDVATEIRRVLERASDPGGQTSAIRAAYQARQYAPLWTADRARMLADALARSDAEALVPANYDADGLRALAEREAGMTAEADIRLTRALVRYARDVRYGQVDPRRVEPEYHIAEMRDLDVAGLIRDAGQAGDIASFLAGLPPATDDYRRLRDGLARYRALAVAGGWSGVGVGPTIRPGERSDRIVALRARLAAEGFATAAPAEDPEVLDEALVESLKAYQARNGLEPDGALGARTSRMLNAPIELRIEQIALNMERQRWLNRDLGRYHILVNLADYTLKLIDGEKTVLESRVIVGTLDNQTPSLSVRLGAIEFNPYWNVPHSIATKEILKEIKRDASYLAKKRMRVFASVDGERKEIDPAEIDWTRYSENNLPYRFRQDPGDINSLGRIKFVVPNRHDIYLHDTPTRGLFNRSERNFSHGCIRVEKARELAEVLLSNERNWSRERVHDSLASEQRRIATLSRAPTVHLVYLTARADENGVVYFRHDQYGRDRALAQALRPRA